MIDMLDIQKQRLFLWRKYVATGEKALLTKIGELVRQEQIIQSKILALKKVYNSNDC